jgi:hypothetical protein
MSTPASQITAQSSAYKQLFPDRRCEQLALIERDLLKWLPKSDTLTGNGLIIPYRYGVPSGRGTKFSVAQGNTAGGKTKNVTLYRKRYYGVVTIDDEDAEAARDSKGAFFRLKEREIEDEVQMVAQDLETHLWRDGNGYIGVISSITSASPSVITLSNAEDVANFTVGQTIGANSAATGATGTDMDGEELVDGIDEDAGTLTMQTNLVTGHSWAATNYLFNQNGDNVYGDGSDVVQGLAAWIPLTAESSGTHLGMSRLDDVTALQGYRQAYLGSVEETIKKLHSKMRRRGKSPETVWLSHSNWLRLEQELGARAVREDGKPGSFGLPGLKFVTPNGAISIYAGAFCPDDRGFLLKRSSWCLYHLKALPHVVSTDGQSAQRGATYDGVEVRIRFWCELACIDMSTNGTFAVG